MATIDKKYIYTVGRTKELEKGLLSEANLDRVLESTDPSAVLRSLGFFKTTDDHEGHESLATLFLRERQFNRAQLHELVADSPLEDIFLLPYDIHNVKLLLKGKLTSTPNIKDYAVEEGKFSKAELLEALFDEVSTNLPTSLMDDVKAVTEEFQSSRRLALIDYRLDRRLRLLQLEIARKARNDFMIEYLQRLSDVLNISTTIRRKVRGFGRESLVEALLDTGTLAVSFFERLYEGGWESLASAFKPTAYETMVSKALAQLETPSFLAAIDVWAAHEMMEFLRTTKQICFGIEPALAFYLARDHELKLVRALWIGKIFYMAQNDLQIRMRELYS